MSHLLTQDSRHKTNILCTKEIQGINRWVGTEPARIPLLQKRIAPYLEINYLTTHSHLPVLQARISFFLSSLSSPSSPSSCACARPVRRVFRLRASSVSSSRRLSAHRHPA